MTYLLRNKPEYRQTRRFLLTAVGLCLGLILILILAPSVTVRTFQLIARPVWQSHNNASVAVAAVRLFFRDKETLVAENESLTQTLQEARLRLLYLEVLERENVALKLLTNRIEATESVVAAILARPPKTPYDVMVIDIGADHNLHSGDIVLAHGNIAIGTVTEVYDRSARVELFSTPEVVTSIFLATDGTALSARGVGNGTFEIKAPRDLAVTVGDVIMIPGLNAKIIGTIESITVNPTDAFKLVLVKSPINIFSLRFVSVIVGS